MARVEATRIWQEENLPLFSVSAADFIEIFSKKFPEGTAFSAEVGEFSDPKKTILEGKTDIEAHLPLLVGSFKMEVGPISVTLRKYSNTISFKEDQRPTAEAILADLRSHVPFHRRTVEILAQKKALILTVFALFAILFRSNFIAGDNEPLGMLAFNALWAIAMAPIIAFNFKHWMRPKVFYVERSNFLRRNGDKIIWAVLAYLAGNLTPSFDTLKSIALNALSWPMK